MRRVLRMIVLLATMLAVLPAPAGGAIPSPETVPLAGLNATAKVIRDDLGVPHVFASNAHDLFFLNGWVHAEDRLFQMDLFRRQASGTLAELFGPSVLGTDVEMRTVGLRRSAERSLEVLSDETLAMLDAYAEGVNAWVAANPLPPEYGALELTTFEPWDPVDSVVIAKLIAFGLSFDLDIGNTQRFLQYVGTGEVAGFDGAALFTQDLERAAPFDPASTVPDATDEPPFVGPRRPRRGQGSTARLRAHELVTRGASPAPAAPAGPTAAAPKEVLMRLAGDYLDRIEDVPLLAAAANPLEREAGSNEWAVSGKLTTNGKPIMANDPHLSLDTPSTFYQIHLRSLQAGYDVIGSSFAGVPGVVLGQNRFITWGATTNPMDVTDTYQEQVVPDPSSPSGLSTIYQGQPEPVIPIPVEFRFNQLDGAPDNLAVAPAGGDIPPVVLIVPRRNNGPILSLDTESGFALSVQYTGFSATRELDTFRMWNQAKNLKDFQEGLQYFDFGSQNWAYMDIAGNIAYFTSAEMPLREDLEAGTVVGSPPWFIRNGTGGNEWLPVTDPQPGQAIPYEILPPEEMPHVINPPAGFFVNANNDPAGTTLDNDPLNQLRPTGGIYYLNPGYDGFRAGRITQVLKERLAQGPVTVADMQAIQADVGLIDAEALVPHILEAFAAAAAPDADPALAALADDPRIAEAVSRLATWDFTTPTGVVEGYDAADVNGQRLEPTADEVAASVAATIYSVWRGQAIRNIIDATIAPFGLPAPGSRTAMSALRNIVDNVATTGGVGASGLDFLQAAGGGLGDPMDRKHHAMLVSLADALDLLAGDAFAPAFGYSTNQDDYRWGRLHRVVFDHPLGAPFSIPPAFGAFPPSFDDLPGIATDGGFGVPDASSHSARADAWNDFMFGGGPVRRYVAQLGIGGRFTGYSALPGGESGVAGSPWYANLLGDWLTNDAHRHRHRVPVVLTHAVQTTVYTPAP